MQGFSLEACLEKAVFLPGEDTLVVSDLHFGKASHFRKAGLAIPDKTEEENLHRLEVLLQRKQPRRIVFAGDAFHSQANRALERFAGWRKTLPHVDFTLVRGNHDILPLHLYRQLGMQVVEDSLALGPVTICHDPAHAQKLIDNKGDAPAYVLCGHLHPGYKLMGPGREALTLPCLWLGEKIGVMPAFGAFTGLYAIKPEPGDRVCLFGPSRVYGAAAMA